MQGMGCLGKRLWRYSQIEQETERGSVTLSYQKQRSYWFNLVPITKSRQMTEGGFVDVAMMMGIVNDCREFKVGDRLGSENEILYEVTSVQTFPTNQQIELKECNTVG